MKTELNFDVLTKGICKMTVAELVAELCRHPNDADVKIGVDEYGVPANGNGTYLDVIDVQNNGGQVSIGAA